MARDAGTDERLDDLNTKVDRLDVRMETGFAQMRDEFRGIRGEMAAQNRMLMQLFGGIFATMLVGFLGLAATVLTQT